MKPKHRCPPGQLHFYFAGPAEASGPPSITRRARGRKPVLQILEQDLPPVGTELARVVGLKAALRLIDTWGGTYIDVPQRPSTRHRRFALLTELIGARAAQVLVAHYGGDRLRLPKASAAESAARARALIAEYDAGATVRDLALRWDMSERHVRRTLNRERE